MWDEPLIPPDRLTVARMLQNSGYRTACFGKWHLGLTWPFVGTIPSGFDTNVTSADIDWTKRIGGGPVDCGFDYFFGINIANEPPYAFIENDHVVGQPVMQYTTVSGQQSHWSGPGVAGWDWSQSLPQITTNTARWIQTASADSSKPFFLLASLVGPHQPVVPSAPFQGTSLAGVYGDYVQEIDWAVGQLLDALETSGAATNTLVIFSSDNGPDEFSYQRLQLYQHASMGPLRGIKSDIWEGGHRVPFLARWPGKIAGGTTNSQTVCLIDFMRTAADLVGAQLPSNAAEDSVSFLPALLGNHLNASANRLLVLESGIGQFGLRSNSWMYINSGTGDGHNPELEPLWFEQARNYVSTTQSPALLYDLGSDLAESSNLLTQRATLAAQLYYQLAGLRSCSIWDGTSSGDWTAANNWLPQSLPNGADVVYSNVVGVTFAQMLRTNFAVNSLILDPSVGTAVQINAAPGGQLTLANGIDMYGANANLTIQAPVALNQSQVWNTSAGHTLEIQGPVAMAGCGLMICGQGDTVFANTISGTGVLRIRSGGTTVLTSKNVFSGGTELSGGGILTIGNNSALGSGGLVIPNNSSVDIPPGITITNSLLIQGYGAGAPSTSCGALTVRSNGIASCNGPIALSDDAGFRANVAGSILSIGGRITGNANVTIMAGAGTVLLTTNQLYTGKTFVGGSLKLAAGPNTLPIGMDVILAETNSAQLDLNDNDQELASISGGGQHGGRVLLGRANLRIAPATAAIYNGSLSGTGNLEKAGSGTLALGGTNNYTGKTVVLAGTLDVTGTLGTTQLEVAGGTLSGSGSIHGPVLVSDGSVLKLAASPGPLTVSNQLVLSAASATYVELDPTLGKSGRVQGMTSVTYGGILIITNAAPQCSFTNGQSFRIFSSASAQGNFFQILPQPAPGLVWHFDARSGVLTAVTQPRLLMTTAGPNTEVITWSGDYFHLQAQTNYLGVNSSNNWFDYPGGWTSPVVVPIDATQPNVFFRLASP
jgi:autotransporter-associated beta strand protein